MSKCICHAAGLLMFPTLGIRKVHDLLMTSTCWPFGDCDQVIGQLRKLADRTDGTLEGAMAYADAITEEAMRSIENGAPA